MKNGNKPRILSIKNFIIVICLPLVAAGLLFSCTEIFSTSLGEWAARDKSKLIPNVTASNIDELIALAEKDPDMSLALLQKIGDIFADPNSKLTDEEKAKLQGAALAAAVNATGMTSALLGAAGGILSLKDDIDPTNQTGLKPVQDAVDSMKNKDEANDLLSKILPDKSTDADGWKAFVDNTSSSDLAMAAVMIYCADPAAPDPLAGDLALACIGKEADESSGLSSTIANLLGDLGLITTHAYEVQYWDSATGAIIEYLDSGGNVIGTEPTETKRVADGTFIYPKDITKKSIKDYEFVRFEDDQGTEITDTAPVEIIADNMAIIVLYDKVP